MRVLLAELPYLTSTRSKGWNQRGMWPCHWIACADAGEPPFVTAYRCRFTVENATSDQTVRVHVTADERYEFFLDGQRIGRGSERGDRNNWFFETYDLPLAPGAHTLVARVWSLGKQAAFAQMTLTPGFLLSPQEEEWFPILGTGVAAWEAKRLGGYTFTNPDVAWGTGANIVLDGSAFDWGFETGEGEGWQPALKQEAGSTASRNDRPPTHLLLPAMLPPMLEEARQVGTVRLVADIASLKTGDVPIRAADNLPEEAQIWQALVSGNGAVTIPANTRRRVLIDLDNYYCAYPEIVTTGGKGARVRVHWQEALYEDPRKSVKGNRDEIEGKQFINVWHLNDGVGDTFLPEGGTAQRYDTLWWQCGRYVEIVVETAGEELTLEQFTLRETRYPLEMESRFDASDPRLADVIPIALRGLQMCSHETYMDCPFFEQLMYIGDTRLEVLTTYALTRDDRLPRKALRMFDASRFVTGLTQSRYPTRVEQIIPPFSVWWVAMLADFALWRNDKAFVRSLLPGARGVLDVTLANVGDNGLLKAMDGWNYMDWVPNWPDGTPPDGHFDVSGVLNWQLILALKLVADVEAWAGEPEFAERARRRSAELAARTIAAFWNEERGLFADDLAQSKWSEHSQCLALLSGHLDAAKQERVANGLLTAHDLERTTIYFTHYLFETLRLLGRTDVLIERLGLWFDLKRNGLKTTVEMPEPTRSDCHAWGAHPLYHYLATILGIRPGSMGFATVEITPQLGPLTHAQGTLVHPLGAIEVDVRQENSRLTGSVTLPDGLSGTLHANGQTTPLHPGTRPIY